VALENVVTPYVFLSDIDFLPMSGLYTYLKKYIFIMNIKSSDKVRTLSATIIIVISSILVIYDDLLFIVSIVISVHNNILCRLWWCPPSRLNGTEPRFRKRKLTYWECWTTAHYFPLDTTCGQKVMPPRTTPNGKDLPSRTK